MKMKIRKATKRDLSKLADIMISEFSKPPYNDNWSKEAALESIQRDYCLGEIYLAIEERKVNGFISVIKEPYTKPILVIENLVVQAESQGKGVGKFLVRSVEKMYSEKGFNMITLITNKKAPSYKFYEKLGYKESANNVTMTKKLRVAQPKK